MSQLSLTKDYEDLSVLFENDLDQMWTQLQSKTNGSIDDDNVASGWGNIGQLTVSDGVTLYFGATSTGYISYTAADLWTFGCTYAGADTIFYVNSVEQARIDASSNDLIAQRDVYFAHRDLNYSLFRILGAYQKPVLTYVSGTEIAVENNTGTANETLIVFPVGPVAVTEDISSTHKFRKLQTGVTANGYDATHTGAADSGMRSGLALAASTWYFVYAVRVQYGDDAGNKFILVVDDTSPLQANESTLNTRYGSSQWVYLGTFRRGYGSYSTTTVIPFQYDHQGWCYFTDNSEGSGDGGAGILVYSNSSFTSTSATTLHEIDVANSGASSVPETACTMQYNLVVTDPAGTFRFESYFTNNSNTILWNGPTQYGTDARKDGYNPRVPVKDGHKFRGALPSSGDTDVWLVITGIQDHYV